MSQVPRSARLGEIALACILAVCGAVACAGPEDEDGAAMSSDAPPEAGTSAPVDPPPERPEPQPTPPPEPYPEIASPPPSAESEAKIERFRETKVLAGWATRRTQHYLLVYDEDVDRKIVDRIAREIELLRARHFERLFPPARPIESIVIVRICESRRQYAAYGAPGGSAGYWSPHHGEVVLYEDRNDKQEALRVAYSMTCQAFIDQALPGILPHPWFIQGHGDYLAGHEYERDAFRRRPFAWRAETARDAKERWRSGILRIGKSSDGQAGDRLALPEWLSWDTREHMGGNDFAWSSRPGGTPRPVPGGVSKALGWSFVWFLQTTDDPGYRSILPRYWETLAGFAQAHEAHEAGEPDVPERSQWLPLALAAALEGVDVEQLERDWLADTWDD